MEEEYFQIKEKKKEKKNNKKFFFRKKNRLKYKNYKFNKTKKYKFILIKYNFNNFFYPRIIIILKKKYIKYSTKRNYIKRIIKETFRLKQYKLKNLDYLIIIKNNIIKLKKKNIFNYFNKIWKNFYKKKLKIKKIIKD